MKQQKSKVYAFPSTEGYITRIDGGYTTGNITNPEDWVLIDEGYGDKYNLCQSNYLPLPLMDERGVYRYKLVDGKAVERTQEEMDADYVPPEPVTPLEDRVGAVEIKTGDLEEALDMILSGVTE